MIEMREPFPKRFSRSPNLFKKGFGGLNIVLLNGMFFPKEATRRTLRTDGLRFYFKYVCFREVCKRLQEQHLLRIYAIHFNKLYAFAHKSLYILLTMYIVICRFL